MVLTPSVAQRVQLLRRRWCASRKEVAEQLPSPSCRFLRDRGVNIARRRIGPRCRRRRQPIQQARQIYCISLGWWCDSYKHLQRPFNEAFNTKRIFPIVDNCPNEPHTWAAVTAQLSEWIYLPDKKIMGVKWGLVERPKSITSCSM